MSYIRNYIIIALVLYGMSGMKYFLQLNLLWTPWHTLKTTNLFILHYMERLYAHVKRNLFPVIETTSMEEIRTKMNQYGLKRDKLYYLMSYIAYNIRRIFGLGNKRNYLAIILTILFTKRALIVQLIVSLYYRKIHKQVLIILHKVYEFIKEIDLYEMRRLGFIMIGLMVVFMSIKLVLKLWTRYKKKVSITETSSQMTSLEELNDLQNKLGEEMIALVKEVRKLDKLLAEKHFEGYEKQQGLKVLTACQAIIEAIKNKIPTVEQVKEIQIYGMSHGKYKKYTLSLIDLGKEAASEKSLQKYQEDEVAGRDENTIRSARACLYDYLKQCMGYYNELDLYLTKVHKGKKRERKKIYKREQLVNSQSASEVMEGFFQES